MPSYLVAGIGPAWKQGRDEYDESKLSINTGLFYVEALGPKSAVAEVADDKPGRYVVFEVAAKSVKTVVVK